MRCKMIGAAILGLLTVATLASGQWPGPHLEIVPDKVEGTAGGLQVVACGPKRNILEARLDDNIHREIFPEWLDLPRCGRIWVAPASTAGAFAIQYEKSKERFIVAAWAETTAPGRARRLIAVSPLSDKDTLGKFAENPRPIVLCWLSPVAVRIAQLDPSMPGEDKLRVVVIRFEPKFPGIWYCTWRGPAPLEKEIKVIARKAPAAPVVLPNPNSN